MLGIHKILYNQSVLNTKHTNYRWSFRKNWATTPAEKILIICVKTFSQKYFWPSTRFLFEITLDLASSKILGWKVPSWKVPNEPPTWSVKARHRAPEKLVPHSARIVWTAGGWCMISTANAVERRRRRRLRRELCARRRPRGLCARAHFHPRWFLEAKSNSSCWSFPVTVAHNTCTDRLP